MVRTNDKFTSAKKIFRRRRRRDSFHKKVIVDFVWKFDRIARSIITNRFHNPISKKYY